MPHTQPTLAINTPEGHAFELIHVLDHNPRWRLLMVPAMGISARHYIDFARALNAQGAEVFIHEWRGLGSSNCRASRRVDWGYRELLDDLAASVEAIQASDRASPAVPMVVAGHSLGSQLGLLIQALNSEAFAGAVCIAGGSPHYKAFPWPMGLSLRVLFALMPALAQMVGHYPGQRLGFAKRESRSVMRDWANSGRTGRYRPKGVAVDLEAALRQLTTPLLGIRMADDWFVPPGSLQCLLDKCPNAPTQTALIPSDKVGGQADHYRWMHQPQDTAKVIGQWVNETVKHHHNLNNTTHASKD